ncbi:hypothetical protein DPSP01_011424 [Paraphaeosphaeria sporulosa]|uniref:Heterokaryon incompatibility domain-containing protein n=1 Tax=Paraphaeosphaeria sporulosa TaxID=1460663 RepID=A0A177CF79_9PLEO|nr:uncharacterized protein CC84DRAFT_1259508 [Paraphaeosphaeria sporulosa]OAG06273.1 hypothetical protein CC84DRAFT_1259508 [Paraphaeosphaeria sporulosa]
MACHNLGYRYLWVDRFCIVQDDEPERKTVQLNQMGAIYRGAAFTVVALAGDDADCGLPGVSEPRTSVQLIFTFADMCMCQGVRPLRWHIHYSEWYDRGWTFQELHASSRCLFFTNEGVFHIDYTQRERHGAEPLSVYEESTGRHVRDYLGRGNRTHYYTNMVHEYTAKTLTFPSDILRAFSGALFDNYESRTVFGLPWADFDRAVLWYVDDEDGMVAPPPGAGVFPSWSWTSAPGQKAFHAERPYGLAYWARVQTLDDVGFPVREIVVARPDENDLRLFSSMKETAQRDAEYLQKARVIAGLAWHEGCVTSHRPREISADCTRERYTERLGDRWPDYSAYWRDAFGRHNPRDLFSAADIDLSERDGRLLLHTQKARFVLDGPRRIGGFYDGESETLNTYYIRNSSGRLVGHLLLDAYQAYIPSDADFLSLAAGTDLLLNYHAFFNENAYWSNADYGCPCHRFASNTSSVSHRRVQHIAECRHHPSFTSPLPNQAELDAEHAQGTYKTHYELDMQAIWRHYAGVSYYGAGGGLMHHWHDVPVVHVMLVAPSTGQGKGTGAYQRLGLGVVYLKRWVEAGPVVGSVVLE